MRNAAEMAFVLAVAVGAAGCSHRSVPAIVDAAPAPPAPPREPFRAARPENCEVEIGGTVQMPKRSKAPDPAIFVAIGDCLGPSPNVVGVAASNHGVFFVEVFVPWGSDLSVCAASEPKEGAPSVLYGKAARAMHAEAEGEVEFRDVAVEVKSGAPKSFPRPGVKK